MGDCCKIFPFQKLKSLSFTYGKHRKRKIDLVIEKGDLGPQKGPVFQPISPKTTFFSYKHLYGYQNEDLIELDLNLYKL